MVGGSGAMKDLGSQQSRFKWMMEGNCSPDPSSPENAYHKNGLFLLFFWFSCFLSQFDNVYILRV